MPGFITRTTGLRLPSRAESAGEIAEIHRAAKVLGRSQATLVVQPPPADVALEPDVVDRAVARALNEARAAGIRGPAITPFLLAAVERATEGRSLAANLGLLEENALLAGSIASELADRDERRG
jgi:pseudouridine-5'-phosphate glycosidase